MWAYVENGSVVEEHFGLPQNWRNYSNFFALEDDVEFLKSIGWYTVMDVTLPVTNDFLEYHGAPVYTVDADGGVVIKACPVLQKDNPPTPEQLQREAREAFMSQLRDQRNRLLRETDWTQMLDVQYGKSEEWIQAWRNYRQALRELPQLYAAAPNDIVIDLNQIVWPNEPKMT